MCVSGHHSEHSSFNKAFSGCFQRFVKCQDNACFKLLHHKGNYSMLVIVIAL